MKKILISLIAICSFAYTFADSPIRIKTNLQWSDEPVVHNPTGNFPTTIWSFKGALYNPLHPSLPVYSARFPISSYGTVSYELVSQQYESFDKKSSPDDIYLADALQIHAVIEQDRREYFVKVFFIPIRQQGQGRFERLTSFELILHHQASPAAQPRGPIGPLVSKLSDGDIYKFAVTQNGIHKLDFDFLKNELGIAIDQIDPRTIKLLGNGGGPLPETVGDFRYEDVEENSIKIIGEEDGSFDSGDFILFYAEGPDKWRYDTDNQHFTMKRNVYDDNNYYFIKISPGNGKRIANQASLSTADYTTNTFNNYLRYEEDSYNLLSEGLGTQGSGQHWYGDPFIGTRERSYDELTFENLITSEPLHITTELAARSSVSSKYYVEVAGNTYQRSINGVTVGDSEATFARAAKISESFTTSSENLAIKISYPTTGDGTNQGWLDYIELNGRCALSMVGDQLPFRDATTIAFSTSRFELSNVSDAVEIWDITDPLNPLQQSAELNNGKLSFGVNTAQQLREFMAFKNNSGFLAPTAVGKIDNQNIHGIEQADMLIVYHDDFGHAAQRLAEHRASYSNLTVQLARIDQVFNEFASGRQDPTAIRDLAQLLFERSPDFKFLLLLGDGSFDFKNKYGEGKNFIPVFETPRTLDPILSYPSDDYFALLNHGEGANLVGALDIGVGRIPARTPAEAEAVVDKIILYDSKPSAMGDWRNRLVFVADDEDSNRHIIDNDNIAVSTSTRHKNFNLNKIYFDAFRQESTPGGARIPKAQESLNRDMFRGILVVNYLGHGGSKGWAQERVLTQADIASWENEEKLPLFVTATCSFTGYDEPTITSAGEQAMLKSKGGVIGLFTTVRAVYATSNFRLTSSVFDTLFYPSYSQQPALGEILRLSKNSNSSDTTGDNSRKFTLIGDPSMKLAIPEYKVATTSINGHDVTDGLPDTLRALQKVTIKGVVQDHQGQLLSNFNGKVYPTIFDKKIIVSTLVQDPGSRPYDFELQKNVLFKGVASVVNGRFEFTFVVPKDIDYAYGFGKISYYAENGVDTDARGYYTNIVIGGADPNALADDQGPLVEVFMNSEAFILGGTTDANPTLLAKLSDDNGINVVGNSIGHDLTGVLDGNTQNTYILNDFYESELDDYTKGSVRFPLYDLEEGRHEIRVKAWDIANNSAEGYTEFIVAASEGSALTHVLNYPNPFTTSTDFQFESNQLGQVLDVQIQVFSMSGKLVKTLQDQLFNQGGALKVNWNGLDDYGDPLAKGVYVYKVKVKSTENVETEQVIESDFERLVILK